MSNAILVTGGAGYIGSHTCKLLAESGFSPVTYDNLGSGHRWAVKWGPLVIGDLSDQSMLSETIDKFDIRAVIHFAAHAYVGESMVVPEKYFRNNVINTLNLLEVLKHKGIDKFVFSSTCATYGVPETVPIDENHVQNPINPYGESKLFIEKALRWHDSAHGLRSVSLRYFNASGADPDGEIGEDHDPETHLIPLIIQSARGLRSYIDIYGIDYPTKDGSAVRDYIHVTDLADAHVRALRYLQDGGTTTALNLGTGYGYSVREVVAAVEKYHGIKVPYRECPRRAGDPAELVANPTKALQMLGWSARNSNIDFIVTTASRWSDKHRDTEPNTQGYSVPPSKVSIHHGRRSATLKMIRGWFA
jgi:UDP-arabinose 4-epimerase